DVYKRQVHILIHKKFSYVYSINLDKTTLGPGDESFPLPDILWGAPELPFYIYITETSLAILHILM
ncbi:hypothetical protein, partial [Escherichia coli]|uniref:hypothetical protein n=2 Tax=Escherichia coli TaxID=562 RepID=UPI000AC2C574